MCTSPEVLRTLQVPQTPKVHPDGITMPALRATARTVSVSLHSAVTSDRAKAMLEEGITGWVQKPVTLEVLRGQLAEALD